MELGPARTWLVHVGLPLACPVSHTMWWDAASKMYIGLLEGVSARYLTLIVGIPKCLSLSRTRAGRGVPAFCATCFTSSHLGTEGK